MTLKIPVPARKRPWQCATGNAAAVEYYLAETMQFLKVFAA
jgi:hypothetical protein